MGCPHGIPYSPPFRGVTGASICLFPIWNRSRSGIHSKGIEDTRTQRNDQEGKMCNTSAEWHDWPFLRKQQSRFVECLEILDSHLRGSDTL